MEKKNLDTICKDYSNENIFNIDETGLFWCAMPNKTLAVANEKVEGTKSSKDRLTDH